MLSEEAEDQTRMDNTDISRSVVSTTRSLLSVTPCDIIESVSTPYNEEPLVPTYVGIMFEIFTLIELEILTFELDVRLDSSLADLAIEIYTKRDDFSEYVMNETAWTQVAKTNVVPISRTNTNMGAIIPYQDVTPVLIPARTKQSFYITMNQPYIDFTVNALDKTGDLQTQTTDLNLYVGAGFSEPSFPLAGINRTVSPKFSGVIYYRKNPETNTTSTGSSGSSPNCDDVVNTFEVDFDFLFTTEAPLSSETILTLTKAIDSYVDKLLNENLTLNKYKMEHGLQKLSETKTNPINYNGDCEADWEGCPAVYYKTIVKLSIRQTLDSQLVQYELYRGVNEIANATALIMAPNLPTGAKTSYIGDEAVVATYEISLIGVPVDSIFDELQKEYFTKVTTGFLEENAIKFFAHVYGMSVDEQTTSKGRRMLRRDLQSATTQLGNTLVSGKIFGAQASALPVENFKTCIEDAFIYGGDDLVQSLKMYGLKPATIDYSTSAMYFNATTACDGSVTYIEPTVGGDSGGGGSSASPPGSTGSDAIPLPFILAGIAGFVGIVLTVLSILHVVKICKQRRETKKTRKERRERSQKQSNNNSSTSSDDSSKTNLPPLASKNECAKEKPRKSLHKSQSFNENLNQPGRREKPQFKRSASFDGIPSKYDEPSGCRRGTKKTQQNDKGSPYNKRNVPTKPSITKPEKTPSAHGKSFNKSQSFDENLNQPGKRKTPQLKRSASFDGIPSNNHHEPLECRRGGKRTQQNDKVSPYLNKNVPTKPSTTTPKQAQSAPNKFLDQPIQKSQCRPVEGQGMDQSPKSKGPTTNDKVAPRTDLEQSIPRKGASDDSSSQVKNQDSKPSSSPKPSKSYSKKPSLIDLMNR